MNQTRLSQLSRHELEQTVIRMRMELHRQEIRHAAAHLGQPARHLKALSHSLKSPTSEQSSLRKWLRLSVFLSALIRDFNRT